jgi:hypothetical protein
MSEMHLLDEKGRETDIKRTRSEVFAAVTMKNSIFWDVTSCGCYKKQCFGRDNRLPLVTANVVHSWLILPILMMKAIVSSEMLFLTRATRFQKTAFFRH